VIRGWCRRLGRQIQLSKADSTGHMLRAHHLTALSLLQDNVHVSSLCLVVSASA